ncbi:MFS transporter small subunit [Singulisphaera rosea]
MIDSRTKTPTGRLALAWIIVLVPLGWGVYQSLLKSLPLLRGTTSATSPLAPRNPGPDGSH